MKWFDIERLVANKYNHLLVMLLVFLLLAPFLETGGRTLGLQIITVALLATIILCLRATVTNARFFWLCVIIAAAAVLLDAIGERLEIEMIRRLLVTLSMLINCFFVGFTILALMANMFRTKSVTSDMIVGGICIYFLIGILWVLFYMLIDDFDKAAIAYTGRQSLTYFSFITLTTLGYGDFVPASEFARMLATLEAVAGQVYLAVFVARLVGLHIAHEIR